MGWWKVGGVEVCDIWLVDCWSFMWLQHLRSYQDGYSLVTVHTRSGSIVLFYWDTRLLGSTIFSTHYPDTELISPCAILIMYSDEHQF